MNHSRRGEAGGVRSTLAPVAALRAIAGKVITELRPTPAQQHRRDPGSAVVDRPNPDPHALTSAVRRHDTHPTGWTQDTYLRGGLAGLPHAHPPIALRMRDGDTLPLWIGSVQQQIAGRPIRMLAYNGSIPGPLLRVAQGSEITVAVTNNAGREQTVHWHGLPLDTRNDNRLEEIQHPIPVLGLVTYRLRFPDPGLYWYHAHGREDDGQQISLSGQIIVDPAMPDDRRQVNREIPLTLTEILIAEDQLPAVHRRSWPTHTVMGDDGTVVLVNGETQPSFAVSRGEVVRLYLTNTATTGIFHLAISGATLKLVGAGSGRYERAEFVDTVTLAPSEGAIVDVLFDTPGEAVLTHHSPDHAWTLATFAVGAAPVPTSFADAYREPSTDRSLTAERARL